MLARDLQNKAEKQGLLSLALSGCCTNIIRPSEAKKGRHSVKKRRKLDIERKKDRECVQYLNLLVPIT